MIKKMLTVFEILFIIGAISALFSGNSSFLFYIFFTAILAVLKRVLFLSDNTNNNISYNKARNSYYEPKPFLTPYEKDFYNKIVSLNEEYIVIPQVNLAAIVNKYNAKYRSELFRNIDFGIFNKNFELLLLIELDDKTHQTYKRRDRDLKVKKILDDCHIKLIKFYTYYPNEKEYVLKRIIDNIINVKNN
ncbi:MAG: DUF2726 domain-containing protein [Ruminococcus sp.]|nr:DUF2726 domain-containing protein [Ruminococcus sp.]